MPNEGINGLIPTGNSAFPIDEAIKQVEATAKVNEDMNSGMSAVNTSIADGFMQTHTDLGDVEGAVIGVEADTTAIKADVAAIRASIGTGGGGTDISGTVAHIADTVDTIMGQTGTISSNVVVQNQYIPTIDNHVTLIETNTQSIRTALGTAQGIVPQTVAQMLYNILTAVNAINNKLN